MDKEWNKHSNILQKRAQDFNINLNPEQLELFKKYWLFLSEYNEHTNLVASADLETVIFKHFVDSLAIGLCKDLIEQDKANKIIDIGIGGGFPGVPIVIAYPEWKLCAVDSVGKKTKFIELLAQELNITDRVEIYTKRAEDILDKREKFDIAVSRAVSQLNTLSEYCLPFVKVGGYFVAYKAKGIETELEQAQKAVSILGGEVEKVISYNLNDDIERNLILIKKIKPTHPKYPRKAGIAKKQPLGINF